MSTPKRVICVLAVIISLAAIGADITLGMPLPAVIVGIALAFFLFTLIGPTLKRKSDDVIDKHSSEATDLEVSRFGIPVDDIECVARVNDGEPLRCVMHLNERSFAIDGEGFELERTRLRACVLERRGRMGIDLETNDHMIAIDCSSAHDADLINDTYEHARKVA